MALFTIRPTGNMSGLVEKGLAKMYRDNPEGGRDEVGDYKNPMLPGGGKGHRIFWDPENRMYPIKLGGEALNTVVKDLRYSDKKTGKLIETADPRNEMDPFFCLEELELLVPNSGITLDDETSVGKLWMAAAKAEPKLFNIDNNTDNPAVKRVQEFNVTTTGHSDNEVKEMLAEGKKASAIFHANKHDYQWMVNVCRGMNIQVASDAKIDALEDVIFLKITTEKDYKTPDGVRYIEKFLLLTDMKQEELATISKIKLAIDKKVIIKEGRRYSFDQQFLGTSPDGVFNFLMKPENTDVRGYILARLEEKSS